MALGNLNVFAKLECFINAQLISRIKGTLFSECEKDTECMKIGWNDPATNQINNIDSILS